jgi:hypothetical protein
MVSENTFFSEQMTKMVLFVMAPKGPRSNYTSRIRPFTVTLRTVLRPYYRAQKYSSIIMRLRHVYGRILWKCGLVYGAVLLCPRLRENTVHLRRRMKQIHGENTDSRIDWPGECYFGINIISSTYISFKMMLILFWWRVKLLIIYREHSITRFFYIRKKYLFVFNNNIIFLFLECWQLLL